MEFNITPGVTTFYYHDPSAFTLKFVVGVWMLIPNKHENDVTIFEVKDFVSAKILALSPGFVTFSHNQSDL
jgi:hypothetical protein